MNNSGWTARDLPADTVDAVDAVDAPTMALLAQLRPRTDQLDRAVSASIVDGVRYRVLLDRGHRPVALAGWRALHTSRGRVLHVEDLITDPGHRRLGAGDALLAGLEETALARGFDLLELDSGVERAPAHRLYLRRGMTISGFHFAKQLRGKTR